MPENLIDDFIARPYPLLLQGVVRHYAWGGERYIPELLGIANPKNRPFAELWMGAHPQSPAQALLPNTTVDLDKLIGVAPEKILGRDSVKRLGPALPYLFKILDARDMLSIQVHPSESQAREGFEREEAAGIPVDAPQRSYKDRYSKPEVHVALTDFWMLNGFRPAQEIAKVLQTVPEFAPLQPAFAGDDLERLYTTVMTLPQQEVDAMLNPLLDRLAGEQPTETENPDYWALKASQSFARPDGRRDRGLLSIYLLNLIRLAPGQGTFQAAGVPHAYLRGINVELMANSDNVLRAGLTPKHIDVPELLKALNFRGEHPQILEGQRLSDIETVFPTPAKEFELCRIDLLTGQNWAIDPDHQAEILIVVSGHVTAESENREMELHRGAILFAPATCALRLVAETTSRCYRARIPKRE
ncbi:mannose-6-phosphate isomerase, class I [candidate division KSB1 bacterium]|nr:mannose-6-phosphate isomerase, class I [candidate division KSB1 bacterium]